MARLIPSNGCADLPQLLVAQLCSVRSSIAMAHLQYIEKH